MDGGPLGFAISVMVLWAVAAVELVKLAFQFLNPVLDAFYMKLELMLNSNVLSDVTFKLLNYFFIDLWAWLYINWRAIIDSWVALPGTAGLGVTMPAPLVVWALTLHSWVNLSFGFSWLLHVTRLLLLYLLGYIDNLVTNLLWCILNNKFLWFWRAELSIVIIINFIVVFASTWHLALLPFVEFGVLVITNSLGWSSCSLEALLIAIFNHLGLDVFKL